MLNESYPTFKKNKGSVLPQLQQDYKPTRILHTLIQHLQNRKRSRA